MYLQIKETLSLQILELPKPSDQKLQTFKDTSNMGK